MDSEQKETRTLADELPYQQQRVRDLLPLYEACGPGGMFAVAMIRASLAAAERAAASGDVVAMLRACKDLQEFEA